MKYYDAGNYFENNHVIRVTIQNKEYVGHISYNIGGNCFGYSVLNNPFETLCDFELSNLVENDCNLRYNEEDDFYYATLKDEDGNTLDGEFSFEDISNMIVCMEIISCEEE